MGHRPIGKLSIALGLGLLVSGCVTPDASSTSSLASVASNGAQFGADTRRFGDQLAIVTYAGSPRGFIACVKRGADVTGTMLLDSRTEVRATSPGVSVTTFYVATTRGATMSGQATPISVTFGRTGFGDFGEGTTCRATGILEQALLQ